MDGDGQDDLLGWTWVAGAWLGSLGRLLIGQLIHWAFPSRLLVGLLGRVWY